MSFRRVKCGLEHARAKVFGVRVPVQEARNHGRYRQGENNPMQWNQKLQKEQCESAANNDQVKRQILPVKETDATRCSQSQLFENVLRNHRAHHAKCGTQGTVTRY